MTWVYLLQSLSNPAHRYISLADDLEARLSQHNRGGNRSTARYKPWTIVTAVRFKERERAAAFEAYLKTGSGWAFANRHLW